MVITFSKVYLTLLNIGIIELQKYVMKYQKIIIGLINNIK